MRKIVFTGGPCAGKTTILSQLKGSNYLVVPESVSDLIEQGITPASTGRFLFELSLMKIQKEKEKQYCDLARMVNKNVICDRGMADAAAFLYPSEYEMLETVVLGDGKHFTDEYDVVVFFESSAHISKEVYDFYNNGRRNKSAEEALQIEKRLLTEWSKIKNFHYIKAAPDFDNKCCEAFEILKRTTWSYK